MSEPWYSVRCLFHDQEAGLYEERITLWRGVSFEHAIEQAEKEAKDYAEILDLRYTGLAQAYHLGDETVGSGSEVFSLCRDSDLDPNAYIDAFFDTGRERQRHQPD
jgi:deoxyadenosine/deoxycytidine kinase